jgi:hypothetical protein
MNRALLTITLAVSGLSCAAGGPSRFVGHARRPKLGVPSAPPRALLRPYRFFAQGKPYKPERVVSLHGEPHLLRPGDVIWIEGVPLRLPESQRRLYFEINPHGRGRSYLQLDGGSWRLVGVRNDYGTGKAPRDAFATLSRAQRSRLWGVSIRRWTPGTSARLAQLEPARSCVHAGPGMVTGKRGARKLRSLPPRLQCLEVSGMPVLHDASALNPLTQLRYLRVRSFDQGRTVLRAVRMFRVTSGAVAACCGGRSPSGCAADRASQAVCAPQRR